MFPTIIVMPGIFYNQIALLTNLNVQMENASQLVGNVMGILTVLIEVMKLIAVSVETFNDAKLMLTNLCTKCFHLKQCISYDSSIVFYNQIALPTNLNVQMDNASQLVGNVMAILTATIEVMKLIVVSL